MKLGLAGQSPLKKGPEGKVQRFVFATMGDAFSSMININQLNGSDSKNTRRVLQSRIAAFFGDEDVSIGSGFFPPNQFSSNCLLMKSLMDLDGEKQNMSRCCATDSRTNGHHVRSGV